MIEDVDYLKKNSEIDSIAFFADSTLRDQKVFPVPAEYSIEFSQPFRNVIGFDILDAAIPSTMYNVDVYNDTFEFTLVKPSNRELTPPNLIVEWLRFNVRFKELFEDNAQSYLILIHQTTIFEPLTDQQEWSPYIAIVKRMLYDSVVTKVASIPMHEKDKMNNYFFALKGSFYQVSEEDPNIENIKKANIDIEISEDMTELVLYTYDYVYISVDEYTRLKNLGRDGHISLITNYREKIEQGNYDVSTLKTELNSRFNSLGIFTESTTLTDIKQGHYRMVAFDYMLVNANKNRSFAKNIGFDLFPNAKHATDYGFVAIGDNERVFTSVFDPVKQTYKIKPPGIVNVTGERFIILRCKEIEDHLYGSFSYSSFIPGIAMFKMGAVTDISNLRFDYVSLVRKPFHPIGKLTKLTFRFETVDGNLYDFKGVNNQMLMMIKFRVPTQKMEFERSILNPNYESDFIRYMYNKRDIENREESDDEQEFDTRLNYITYNKKIAEYDYSSSEEAISESDDDSEVTV